MIGELAQNLINLVKKTEGDPFGPNNLRVSMSMGGKEKDPLLNKVQRPAAWIIFTGDTNASVSPRPSCAQMVQYTFTVQILIDYTTDTDMLTKQLPILDAVRRSVHSVTGPQGNMWTYAGQQLTEMNDRLIYEQNYTISAIAT